MNNTNYNVNNPQYNEAAALQQLLVTAHNMLEDADKALEAGDDHWCQFTITINGVQTAFLAGAPQFEALIAFVNHIAGENLYEVDTENKTVKGW